VQVARSARRTGSGSTFQQRRQPGQGRASDALTIRYRCPHCGGEHPAAECVAVATIEGLSLRELRRLLGRAEHELAEAVRHGQPYADLAAFVAAIESRIARDDGERAPSVERRQRLAAERSATRA
jgi:hypothetical protein